MKEASVPQKLSAFPVGETNVAYAQYFSGRSFIAPLANKKVMNCPINNVSFEPGCRNRVITTIDIKMMKTPANINFNNLRKGAENHRIFATFFGTIY